MTDLNLFDAGCEPSRGFKGATISALRRLLRKALRPSSDRLAGILGSLSARLEEQAGWIREVDRNVALAEARGVARVGSVIEKAEGLSGHVEGLGNDVRELAAEVAWRKSRVESLAEVIGKLSVRMDELDEKVRRVEALHWDHVALARRLAAIEDRLAEAGASPGDDTTTPLIPFPGLEDVPQARVS